jgi:Subtilase family/Fervidolysin N-terminal prodomain
MVLGPALLLAGSRATAADTLDWNPARGKVTADIQSVQLEPLLEGIARRTGWDVYLESNTTHTVSAKFKDLPTGEALRNLLGDLNFALVPQTNARSRLYVFRSSQHNATQLIEPKEGNVLGASTRGKAIPNELIVRLKPGASIDELARALGAKVVGRIEGMNAYRLQFSDEDAAAKAREQLAGNADVASVESNYLVDSPPAAQRLDMAGAPPIQLKFNPPNSSDQVIVALIDTELQKLGNDLDKFVLDRLSVAGAANSDPNSPTHATGMFENIMRAGAAASRGSSSFQVLSVDIYGPNATTSTFDLANGIAQAVNNNPSPSIINLSLGSPNDSPILHDLIRQVTQKGIPVFAAAGNDGTSELFYPAAYPEVTSVTAGSQGKIAGYANYGPTVDLMAPGSGVIQFGNNTYLVSGTSTSTAFVSGMAAATAAGNRISASQVAQALLNSSQFKYTAPK